MAKMGGTTQGQPVLACPRDGGPTEQRIESGVPLDVCASCGGVWFDAKELRVVAGDREVERLATRIGEFPRASALRCPRCTGACVASAIGEVEVDTCTVCHGAWLDRGELEAARREVATRRILADAGPGFRSFLARL